MYKTPTTHASIFYHSLFCTRAVGALQPLPPVLRQSWGHAGSGQDHTEQQYMLRFTPTDRLELPISLLCTSVH